MIKKWHLSFIVLLVMLFVAACTPVVSDDITITFDSNGGSAVVSITTDGKSYITIPGDPEKDGYIFDGWFWDNETFLEPFYDDDLFNQPVTKSFTVYAKWLVDEEEVFFTVTFNAMGGTFVEAIEVKENQLINAPTAPTRDEHHFEGWFTDQNFQIAWDFAENRVVESLTLYAKWRELSHFEVTFVTNTDQNITPMMVLELSKCDQPEITREGYFLEGWYTSDDGGQTLDSKWYFYSYVVTEDVTLYANWSLRQYNLTYQNGDGSIIQVVPYLYQTPIAPVTDPVLPGYVFDGWYLDTSFQTEFNLETMPAYHLAVYAKWVLLAVEEPNAHDVIRLVAYSYFNQGVQLQYDQGTGRRLVIANPEAATADHYLYFDCSSWVNSVYYEAFGIFVTPQTTATNASTYNYIEYARINRSTSSEVLYYIENANVTNVDDQKALLTTIWNNLEPGDLVVYRRNNDSAGHVMLYVGDDMFLHSTGSDYDYTNQRERMEANGTVLKLAARDVLGNTASSRYMFASNVTRFAVLRPLNRGNITFTPSSVSRFNLPGIDIEKSSSITNYGSVGLGEEITYNIRLKNFGVAALQNFSVTDLVPTMTSYVVGSGDGDINDDEIIYWISQLDVNETITFDYTVTVDDDRNNIGEMIESKHTKVENIPSNHIYHIIIAYNADDIEQLVSAIDAHLPRTDFSQSIDLIKSIYDQFATSMSTTNPVASFTTLTAMYNSDLVVPMLHGGTMYNQSQSFNRELRVRLLFESHLQAGDMLFVFNGSTFRPYIYTGEYLISLNTTTGIVTKHEGSATINQILVSAIAFTSYKVLRPMMVME